jgi:CheY-like chemotaxis protein
LALKLLEKGPRPAVLVYFTSETQERMPRQREILCIDDDIQSLRIRRILLESIGYKVTTETDPERGLRLFRSREVDAVIMDYQMPGMNGGEAALEMKRLRPDVPVLILSSLPWLPDNAPQDAIDGFIQKSEPLRVLSSRIEQLIAQHEQTEQSRHEAAEQLGGALGHFFGSLTNAFRKKAAVH